MLQNIRNKAQGIVAYIIVILIAVTFALWGVDALIGNMGSEKGLAEVNGVLIDKYEVEKQTQIYIQNIVARNPKIDIESLNMDLIRQNVLADLISKKLIQQATNEFDLAVNEDKVEKFIVDFPQFSDTSGRFNLDNYKAALRNMGETPQRFRNLIKDSMLSEQLIKGVGKSAFILDNEVEDLLNLKNQKRTFRFLELPNSRVKNKISLTEEEIADFYRKNKNRYMSEEKVKVSYILFDPKNLEKEFEPTQEDYKAEYEKYKASIIANETKRRVAHILLKFGNKDEKKLAYDKLSKIKKDVEQGGDFAKFSKEISMDMATSSKGGDLGFADFYALSPLFAAEVNKLTKVSELSSIVETKQGLHLIKLLEINLPKIKAMTEVKSELRANFMAAPLRAKTTEVLEDLKNLSFSEEKIAKLAEKVKLDLQKSSWLNKTDLKGIWSQPLVQQNLFNQSSVVDGVISEPIKMSDGSYLLFQKDEYAPEQEIAFEKVRREVKTDLTDKKLVELNKKETEELLKSLRDGKSFELDWNLANNTTRDNAQYKREILEKIFSMNPTKTPSYEIIELMNGDLALVELLKVDVNPALLDSEVSMYKNYLSKKSEEKAINNFMLNLRENAEVKIN